MKCLPTNSVSSSSQNARCSVPNSPTSLSTALTGELLRRSARRKATWGCAPGPRGKSSGNMSLADLAHGPASPTSSWHRLQRGRVGHHDGGEALLSPCLRARGAASSFRTPLINSSGRNLVECHFSISINRAEASRKGVHVINPRETGRARSGGCGRESGDPTAWPRIVRLVRTKLCVVPPDRRR